MGRIERTDWGRGIRQPHMVLKVYEVDPNQRDYNSLTPIARCDWRWQEEVLMALINLKPARAFTYRFAKPVIAALLELTF